MGHGFGKNDKCTFCGYKREAGTVEVTSPTIPVTTPTENTNDEQDTNNHQGNSTPVDTTEKNNQTPNVMQGDTVYPEPASEDDFVIWIVIAVIAALVGGVIILTEVVLKKSKK